MYLTSYEAPPYAVFSPPPPYFLLGTQQQSATSLIETLQTVVLLLATMRYSTTPGLEKSKSDWDIVGESLLRPLAVRAG
jgi:hypothetical protein